MWQFFRKGVWDGGFSVIELMVTTGIVTAIISVILLNQSRYTEAAALRAAADELALTIRQAQVYSIGVRESGTGTGDFSVAYGVHLDTTSEESKGSYVFFVDNNKNKRYDGSLDNCTGECIYKVNLPKGYPVSSLCGINQGGTEACNMRNINITFERPQLEAEITGIYEDGNPTATPLSGIKIDMQSPKQITKIVTASITGQISISDPPPPPPPTGGGGGGAGGGSGGGGGGSGGGDNPPPPPPPPAPSGSCSGTYSCLQWTSAGSSVCSTYPGCSWSVSRSRCDGTSRPCSVFGTQSQCSAVVGCTWNPS